MDWAEWPTRRPTQDDPPAQLDPFRSMDTLAPIGERKVKLGGSDQGRARVNPSPTWYGSSASPGLDIGSASQII
jgi:hypothetical protein